MQIVEIRRLESQWQEGANHATLIPLVRAIIQHQAETEELNLEFGKSLILYSHQIQQLNHLVDHLLEGHNMTRAQLLTMEPASKDNHLGAPEQVFINPATVSSSPSDQIGIKSGPVVPASECAHKWWPHDLYGNWTPDGLVYQRVVLHCIYCDALKWSESTPVRAAQGAISTSAKQDSKPSVPEVAPVVYIPSRFLRHDCCCWQESSHMHPVDGIATKPIKAVGCTMCKEHGHLSSDGWLEAVSK